MPDSSIENVYPLTPLQSGMLFHALHSPQSGAYIDQIHFELALQPDQISQFQHNWNTLLERHPALRSAFIWRDVSQPVQVVKDRAGIEWEFVDFSELDTTQQQNRFDSILHRHRHTDFDFSRPPLIKLSLIDLGEDRQRLLWTFHHLILDGWSVAILLNELEQLFRPDVTLPPAPRPFADHVKFLASKKTHAPTDESFWSHYLENVQTSTRVSNKALNSNQTFNLQQTDIQLSDAQYTSLNEFARNHRLSLNTLYHAAWSLTLMSQLQLDDVVYGATLSGRDPELKGVETMVGVLINSLPVRVRQKNQQSVLEWLQILQSNLTGLNDYQHCALSDIKRWSDLPAHADLFESLIVVENYPIDAQTEQQTNQFKHITHVEQSHLPCVLLVLPGLPLSIRMISDGTLFSSAQSRDWLQQVHHILTHLHQWLDHNLNELDVLSATQRARLLTTKTSSKVKIDAQQTIVESINYQTGRQQSALVDRLGESTYPEVRHYSTSLAALLIEQGIQTGDVIAIALPRSSAVIKCMLGVLKCGAAYSIIDLANPDHRIMTLVDQLQPRLIICDQHFTCEPILSSQQILNIELVEIDSSTENKQAVELPPINPSSPAYVLFTSGSTGVPKGVMISHANLCYSTLVREHHYPKPPQTFLLLSPFHFDSSVVGIYWTLVNGGKLIISEDRIEQDMNALLKLIDDHHVTHTLCLPSVYELLLTTAKSSGQVQLLQSLNTVIVAGEPLNHLNLLKLHQTLLPACRLYNEYGPTEATVWSSVYDASNHDLEKPIPIGQAIDGTEVIIIDQHHRLVPPGAVGELCIAGPGVCQGYINLETQTAAHFVELEFNNGNGQTIHKRLYKTGDLGRLNHAGEIEYLGRLDDQIKIRGQRLELGEIETTLIELDEIDEAKALLIDHTIMAQSDLDQWLADQLQRLDDDQLQSLLYELDSAQLQQGKTG